VIIHDFHVERVSITPCESDSILTVDSNAVLFPAIAQQPFEAQAWISLGD